MANIWKEPYSPEKAKAAQIHGYEGSRLAGKSNAEWIYYVEVLNFRFTFFSIEMLDEYIDFFERKIPPATTTHWSSPFSEGPAASIGDGQGVFERLPSWLRKKNKKPKVLKALKSAKKEFTKDV